MPRRNVDPVGGADEVRLYLDKRYLLAVPLMVALSVGVVAWASAPWPLGVLGVFCTGLVVVRHLDPRPAAVITSDGMQFGGLFKSAPFQDVWVPWSNVRSVGHPRSEHVDLHLSERTPLAPDAFMRLLRRTTPRSIAVFTTDGRCYKVYSPGRGQALSEVRAEIIGRWHASDGPSAGAVGKPMETVRRRTEREERSRPVDRFTRRNGGKGRTGSR